MIKKTNLNYKWYILFLAMITYGIIGGAERLCMPVLFKDIGDNLHLSITAIGTVWGMDPLAGVFVGLPSGLLADRFGIKRTVTVLCIFAGIFCALRGFSVNFITLVATMFLFGLMAASAPTVVTKVTAEWFSGKRLGLANAMINAAYFVGAMASSQFSATALAPALGGWRSVMFFWGAPALVLGLLWLFTGRDPDKNKNPELLTAKIPFRQAIAYIIRKREVWIIGLVSMTTWGASTGLFGYLPLYLRNIGWTDTGADSTVTVLNLMMCIGSIPMALLSDKLNNRREVLAVCIAAFVLGLALLPFVSATGVWLLIIFTGFLRSGAGILFNVMILEAPGIGSTYGGTAIGLASSFAMIGAAAAPPIGNSLADISPGLPFIFWACLAAAGIVILYVFKTKKSPAIPSPQ